jgi:hypothetical protein
MPERKRRSGRRITRLAVFSLTVWGLVSLGRPTNVPREPVAAAEPVPEPTPVLETPARRKPRKRFGPALVFAVLFFAGASVSAVAGDQAVQLLAEDQAELNAAAEPAAELPAEEAPAEEPALAEEPAPAEELAPAEEPAATPGSDPAVAEEEPAAEPEPAPADTPEDLVASPDRFAPSAAPAERPRARAQAKRTPNATRPAPVRPARPLDPEGESPAATIWLHRAVPEAIPSFRMTPRGARNLVRASKRAGLDWTLVLGVLRANGKGTVRDGAPELAKLGAARDAWNAALAYTGRTAAADRALALARYYEAVGLGTIVQGLPARKRALTARLLADPRVSIYPGGRADLAAGRIDVRVVAVIAYLAETYGQVTVSSLFSGHRLYARPGVVSAHVYGEAVDIAALGGQSVVGNQRPGGLVERAVRDILLLPADVRPRQLISLLGLGGPSFPLADHGDHIHVGF